MRRVVQGRGTRHARLLSRHRPMPSGAKGKVAISSAVEALERSSVQLNTHSDPRLEKFSIAPMMDYTDRHFRFLLRMITRRAWLYTEMVTAEAIIHGNVDRHLRYHDSIEHPVVLQLGGSNPDSLSKAVGIAKPYNYDVINLNCGCPSQKVSGKGCFGAALMRDRELTRKLCAGMIESAEGTPVTVKCRIGTDNNDSYEELCQFIECLASAGVRHFIIHARIAVLDKNFSPKQNREIPPLRYDYVHRLVKDYPDYTFVLNGGVKTYEEIEEALTHGVAGVMVGREILAQPWYWGDVDRRLFASPNPGLSRREILETYSSYAKEEMKNDPKLGHGTILKPVQNLFVGERGVRKYKQTLSEMGARKAPVDEILKTAVGHIADEDLDKRWPSDSHARDA